VKSVIFLYYLVCYTSGAAGLIAAIAYSGARRSIRDIRFALFSGSFALIVISFTAFAYLDSAGGAANSVNIAFYAMSVAGNSGLVYALPAFMDSLVPGGDERPSPIWAVLAAAAAVCGAAGVAMAYGLVPLRPVFVVMVNAQFAFMLAAVAYGTARGVISYSRMRKDPSIRDEGWRGAISSFSIASLALFPFIVTVDLFPELFAWRWFPGFSTYVRAFPLLYGFFNAVYLARVFRVLLRGKAVASAAGGFDDELLASAGLSAREAEVARLLASGVAYKEIAWRLGIKMGTVQSHVMGVYRKLGVACKEDLMRKARGEISPGRA
jgi:DNA-binding CsgD family transcriptional regulator